MKKILSSTTKWMNLEGIMLSKISQRKTHGITYMRNPKKKEVKCMKESGSEVVQSSPTLCNAMDCSLPASSTHGIFQARVMEWVDISFSRKSS